MSYSNPLDDMRALIVGAHELANLTRSTTRELLGVVPPISSTRDGVMPSKAPNEGVLHDLGGMALVALESVRDAICEAERLRNTLLDNDPAKNLRG